MNITKKFFSGAFSGDIKVTSIVFKSHMKKPSTKVDGFFNDIRCAGDIR